MLFNYAWGLYSASGASCKTGTTWAHGCLPLFFAVCGLSDSNMTVINTAIFITLDE